MGNRMNVEAARSNISYYPMRDEVERPRPSWILRATNWLGITMTRTDNPRGFSFNPAVITLVLVIAGMVAGGAYYMGQRDAENRHLLERLQKAEMDAAEAKKLQTYSAGVADTHAKEEKKK